MTPGEPAMATAPAGGEATPGRFAFVGTSEPRWTSGEVGGLSSRRGRVRLPHGVLVGLVMHRWRLRLGAHSVSKADGSVLRGSIPPPPADGWSSRLRSSDRRAARCQREGCGCNSRGSRWEWKCVRRWLGACLLSMCSCVQFPPLPLGKVPSSEVPGWEQCTGRGRSAWYLEPGTSESGCNSRRML